MSDNQYFLSISGIESVNILDYFIFQYQRFILYQPVLLRIDVYHVSNVYSKTSVYLAVFAFHMEF